MILRWTCVGRILRSKSKLWFWDELVLAELWDQSPKYDDLKHLCWLSSDIKAQTTIFRRTCKIRTCAGTHLEGDRVGRNFRSKSKLSFLDEPVLAEFCDQSPQYDDLKTLCWQNFEIKSQSMIFRKTCVCRSLRSKSKVRFFKESVLAEFRAVSYTHLTLPTKRIV